MSEKNKQRMEKFVALCDSGKPWYVFLVLFSLLLAANALFGCCKKTEETAEEAAEDTAEEA